MAQVVGVVDAHGVVTSTATAEPVSHSGSLMLPVPSSTPFTSCMTNATPFLDVTDFAFLQPVFDSLPDDLSAET